ncbi:MAG: dynamin family protein [Clostridiales bacterium]|nr:dynamin family protein [Clostridiales bacterium]
MSNHIDLVRLLIDDSKNDNLIEDMHLLDNIIFKDIYSLISQKTPPNFPAHHYNLKESLKSFTDKLIYKQLAKRRTVSLGGSFSSGKSSFVNSILNINMLPEGISPTTAVPTYILKAGDTNIFVVNNYQNDYKINFTELKNISYSYSPEAEHIKISHLIKNIIIETQKFPFDNLVFLDTPGYTKSEVYDSGESDEARAMFYYNSSDYIFWFVPSDVGTITEGDLEVLQKIKKGIPKLIIINKADKLTPEDLQKVTGQIKASLEARAISYTDIFTFSKRMPSSFDKQKILDFLDTIDTPKEPHSILDGFNDFFDTVLAHYSKLIIDESRRLFRLNHAATFIEDAHALNSILILTDEVKENIMSLKTLVGKLNALRVKLFITLRDTALKFGVEAPDNFDEYITNNTKDFLTKVYAYNGTTLVNRNFEYNRKVTRMIKGLDKIMFTESFNKTIFEFNDTIHKYLGTYKGAPEKLLFSKINYLALCSKGINTYLGDLTVHRKG